MKKNYIKLLTIITLLSTTSCNQNENITNESSNEPSIEIISSTSIDESNIQESSTSELEKISKVTFDIDFMNNDYAKIIGKNYFSNDHVVLTQSLSYVDVNFVGTKLIVTIEDPKSSYITVLVDDDTIPDKEDIKQVCKTKDELIIVENLENTNHHVRFYKNNEAAECLINLYSIETDGYFLEKDKKDRVKIEYFGDSISCGYGMYCTTSANNGFVMAEENACPTYAYYASYYAEADFIMTCASGWGIYSSYGGNTKASIAKYVSKCDFTTNTTWDNSLFKPDFVVINLGTNDAGEYKRITDTALKATYLENVRTTYFNFIDTLIDLYGNDTIIVLSYGMMGLTQQFTKIITDICDKYDNCQYLLYKSMDKVGGMMPAGHPNMDMHKYASEELYMMFMPYVE